MFLQLAGVVIAREIKLVEARNDTVIYDLDNVRLLHVFRHSADDRPIFTRWRRPEPCAVPFDHFREVKIYLITRAILDECEAVTIFDLAAHRWNTHRRLRAAANLRRPFLTMRHLY